jgi:hypothetical protein
VATALPAGAVVVAPLATVVAIVTTVVTAVVSVAPAIVATVIAVVAAVIPTVVAPAVLGLGGGRRGRDRASDGRHGGDGHNQTLHGEGSPRIVSSRGAVPAARFPSTVAMVNPVA